MPCFNCTVPQTFSDEMRLDKYISSLPDGISRSRLKNSVSKISINGKQEKLSYKVKPGDNVYIEWEDTVPDYIEPEDIPLSVIYEDENVTVINKQQGMVTHPAAGNWNGTLVNALLYHWGQKAVARVKEGTVSEILASRRPGIVHRLDKDTSGTIITAKNKQTEDWLQNQFQTRKVRKEYIAIVCGRPPARNGDIRTQLIRDPKNRKKYKAVTGTTEGKSARTLYHCIACYGNFSLMRLRLKTGRTHQIRVHMKYIGCPILGDPLYNQKGSTLYKSATLMLHARLLQIHLPGQKQWSIFKADVPQRFKDVLKILHQQYAKEVL